MSESNLIGKFVEHEYDCDRAGKSIFGYVVAVGYSRGRFGLLIQLQDGGFYEADATNFRVKHCE